MKPVKVIEFEICPRDVEAPGDPRDVDGNSRSPYAATNVLAAQQAGQPTAQPMGQPMGRPMAKPMGQLMGQPGYQPMGQPYQPQDKNTRGWVKRCFIAGAVTDAIAIIFFIWALCWMKPIVFDWHLHDKNHNLGGVRITNILTVICLISLILVRIVYLIMRDFRVFRVVCICFLIRFLYVISVICYGLWATATWATEEDDRGIDSFRAGGYAEPNWEEIDKFAYGLIVTFFANLFLLLVDVYHMFCFCGSWMEIKIKIMP